MNVSFPTDEITATDDPSGRTRHHRRVIGAKRQPRVGNWHVGPAELKNFMAKTITEEGIGRDATCEDDGASAELERGSRGLDRQGLDDRFLERGGEVGDRRVRSVDRRQMGPEWARRAR